MKHTQLIIKIWLIGLPLLSPIFAQAQIKNEIADQAQAAFDAAFLWKTGTLTYYRESLSKNSKDYFWMQALDIQTPQDAYFRTNNPAIKTQITDLLNTFVAQNGLKNGSVNWEWNEYNDDLFWAVLAFARGYEFTKNEAFYNNAAYGFSLAYYHTPNGGWGWDNQFDGGIWWSKKKEDKNALSNSPGVIAACYLYQFKGDNTYLTLAKNIYVWERAHIWDPVTGDVWSAILANGTINKGLAIFNNGAFGGAANFLYQITGEKSYYNDAKLTFDRVMNSRTFNGILAASSRGGTETAEYIRYLSDFVRQNYLWNEYYSFMKRTADAAWKVRRTDKNLTWNDFTKQTPTDTITAVIECNSAVVMQQVTPVLQTLPGVIEAEDYNYMKDIEVQTNTAASGGKNVGAIATGDWLEYILNIPTSGTYTINFKVSGTTNGSVALQQNGVTLSTINLPATGNLQTYSTVSTALYLTAGIQSIKLKAVTGGWNIDNWSATLFTAARPGRIQAESYTTMSGINTETTIDLDGGRNVGYIETGDWMDYTVTIPTTGTYNISYRVSGKGAGGSISLQQNGQTLANTAIPNTGEWQNWSTVKTTATLTAGTQTIRLLAATGGFNINWWSAEESNPITAVRDLPRSMEVTIYPNPVTSQLTVECGDQLIEETTVFDYSGRILLQDIDKKQSKTTIDVSSLSKGIYILEIKTDKQNKIIKKFAK